MSCTELAWRVFFTLLTAFAMSLSAVETRTVEAHAIQSEIVLDGILNEADWQGPAATGFTQREPVAGAASTEPTEVRIAYTPATLYIGIRAKDSDPGAVTAKEMRNDAELYNDDAVAVLLDTFLDHRNGYVFETNPNGARTEGLINDEGESVNMEWDGLWQVAARRTEDGWAAEMAIPFSTLRFEPGSDWGLNVRRMIRRKNEEAYWSPIPLEADIWRFSLAGRLTGLDGISPGLNLRAKPFAVASGREDLTRRKSAGTVSEERPAMSDDMGLDLKWGVGRGLSLDLTVNTDFAESEADEQQVNLSRFSLFLPEKREFFLENAGIFEFGPRNAFGPPAFRPFFSRRIGLGEDGEALPIEFGGRLTGRTGPWSLGVLDARTTGTGTDDWGVLRVRRQVGGATNVGMMATRHDSPDGESRLYGADADWKNSSSRLKVRGFWAGSDDPQAGTDWAGGMGASYKGPVWRWSLDALQIGDDFESETGFLLRRGVRRFSPTLTFVPRPDIPGIRNLFFEGRGEVYTDLNGEVESSFLSVDLFALRTQKEDVFTLYAEQLSERLAEPFEIRPGVVIPAGEYRWDQQGFWFETNAARALYAIAWYQVGSFYNGDRTTHGGTVRVRPSRFLSAESSWDHNQIELPAGSFSTNLFRERLQVNLTPDLSTSAFVQFSDAAELLAANLRLGWTYRPGADLFLVLNQRWDAPTLGLRTVRDRQAILKLTYLIAV
ncbi:MAG TPA: DUF5916 domain-containing protein [Thermoanaerobaculia bacterium]|jgi:hypothetical protein|nr:DUF5916 domain-containing protein [Thermoanaerobaculia bacterium]